MLGTLLGFRLVLLNLQFGPVGPIGIYARVCVWRRFVFGSFVQVLTMARAQNEIETPQITRGIEANPGHQTDKGHTKERVEHK